MEYYRQLDETDYIGTNLVGMKNAAENLGFTTNAMRGEVKDATLNQKIIFPFIAHVRIPYDNIKLLDHYVVVTNISKYKVTIWDPDFSRGKHKLSRSDFLKIWTSSRCLLCFTQENFSFV